MYLFVPCFTVMNLCMSENAASSYSVVQGQTGRMYAQCLIIHFGLTVDRGYDHTKNDFSSAETTSERIPCRIVIYDDYDDYDDSDDSDDSDL